MDVLLTNAQRLIDAMRDALSAGQAEEQWTVFVGPDGGTQMIAGECGSIDSLTWSRGARMVWRVRRERGAITVEAIDGARRCRIEEPARRTARLWPVLETRDYLPA